MNIKSVEWKALFTICACPMKTKISFWRQSCFQSFAVVSTVDQKRTQALKQKTEETMALFLFSFLVFPTSTGVMFDLIYSMHKSPSVFEIFSDQENNQTTQYARCLQKTVEIVLEVNSPNIDLSCSHARLQYYKKDWGTFHSFIAHFNISWISFFFVLEPCPCRIESNNYAE